VFAGDICDEHDITNVLTRSKIERVCKSLASLFPVLLGLFPKEKNALWSIACFAVFFVLTLNEVPFNENKSGVKSVTILHLAKAVLPYRDDIIEKMKLK
jgi:hypothetical membrane protein